MSEILVSFGSLQQVETDIQNTKASINQQLDDLRVFVSKITHSWTGEAATGYQARQREWDTAAADLNAILGQIGVAVGLARDDFADGERSNTRIWT
ncbi:MAG: WXG100 family type VII secretion target [Pseudonocardiales bacterium]